jgi:CRP-like cAMP-binding protein
MEKRLYLVEEGEVNLMSLNEKFVFRSIKQGELFCENEFFSDLHPHYSAKTTKMTTLIYFNKKDFLELLKDYPLDDVIF